MRDWLPSVFQAVEPYYTPVDIERGQIWFSQMLGELAESRIGIFCITPDALKSQWVLFEAGAIGVDATSAEDSRVCALLFGTTTADVKEGPFAQYQASEFNQESMRKLLASLNTQGQPKGTYALAPEVLAASFGRAWNELDERIGHIMSEHAGEGANLGAPDTAEFDAATSYRELSEILLSEMQAQGQSLRDVTDRVESIDQSGEKAVVELVALRVSLNRLPGS